MIVPVQEVELINAAVAFLRADSRREHGPDDLGTVTTSSRTYTRAEVAETLAFLVPAEQTYRIRPLLI